MNRGRVRAIRLRQPSTLGAGLITSVIGTHIFSARQVGFLVKATNSEVLQTAVISVGNNGTNWNSVGSNTATDVAGVVAAVDLSLGGRWMMLVPGPGVVGRYEDVIQWSYCRIQLTADVADITGLSVDHYIWDDLDLAKFGNGEIPIPIGA